MTDTPAPDVVRIMKEIRESIQRKRQQGIYTDEEVEALANVRLRAWADGAAIDPGLLDLLMHPSHDWNIASDYQIQTTRSGLGAWLIVTAKKLARPLVRLYTDHVLNRQAQLNLYFYYLLKSAVCETARLQVEQQALRSRVEELRRERDALEARMAALEGRRGE